MNVSNHGYRNARPLDYQWWRVLIEGADNKEFCQVLGMYQNEDGGFGHALEPDSWNPNSSPYQTNWWAVE